MSKDATKRATKSFNGDSLAAARKEVRSKIRKRTEDSSAAETRFGLEDNLFSALLAAGEPMSLRRLNELFTAQYKKEEIKTTLASLEKKYAQGPLVLRKTANGYRFHIAGAYAAQVRHITEDAPPRYSNALMETLAVIAYRQPITKAEIEELRGVTLSGNIMRTLQEHEWIKIVGHKQVPGRPAIWGTTKTFLDSFNLENLSQLPPLPQKISGKETTEAPSEETGGKGTGHQILPHPTIKAQEDPRQDDASSGLAKS